MPPTAYFAWPLLGKNGAIVALDGMPLAVLRAMGSLVLAPAHSAELIVDVTGTVWNDMVAGQGAYLLADLPVCGADNSRTPSLIAALLSHGPARPVQPSHHPTLAMMRKRHGGSNN